MVKITKRALDKGAVVEVYFQKVRPEFCLKVNITRHAYGIHVSGHTTFGFSFDPKEKLTAEKMDRQLIESLKQIRDMVADDIGRLETELEDCENESARGI